MSGSMFSELQHWIVLAVLGDANLDAIEARIIDPAPIDSEHKSALWLYAEALLERRRRGRRLVAHRAEPRTGYPGHSPSRCTFLRWLCRPFPLQAFRGPLLRCRL